MIQKINILYLTLIFISGVYGQLSTSLSVSGNFDDNLYRSPEPQSEMLTDINLNLSYSLWNDRLDIFYNPEYFAYNVLTDHNFFYHGLGLDFSDTYNDERINLYTGLNFNIRDNQPVFDYLNYRQFYGYFSSRFNLDYLFLKTGYNFRTRNYVNYTDLNNTQHYLFLQLNKSFQTKTSVILEADYGYKSFSGSEEIYSTDTIMVGGGGNGPGSGGGQMSSDRIITSVNTLEPIDLAHIILMARVAQSLHPRVGIFVQYRLQMDLSGNGAYNSGGYYFQDEEIFDDPFSYESQAISSRLTLLLPWNMQLKWNGSFKQKQYISEQAYLSPEDTLALGGDRQDDRLDASMQFTKTFYPGKAGMRQIQFILDWTYIDNRSNSYWYDYRNNLIGAELRWSF